MKKNLYNWLLSNKKCFVMFSNSDLMNERGDKEEWARSVFENLFRIQDCENGEKLHRVVTEIRIGIVKKGEKKASSNGILYFMETKRDVGE